MQRREQKPRGVIAILLRNDRGAAAIVRIDHAHLEIGLVAREVLPRDRVQIVGLQAPADHLLGGDRHRQLRQVDDKDDDGAVHERHMGNELAVELFKDRLGLDARHDAGAGNRKRERRGRNLVALEEPLQIIFHDLLRISRVAQDHAIEVFQAKMPAVEDDMQRAGDRGVARGILPTEQLNHMGDEGIGLEWKVFHGGAARGARAQSAITSANAGANEGAN